MTEWLVEQGIGEHRAILLDGGSLRAARLDWPGKLSPGQIEDAILVSRHAGSRRGTVRFASGEEALVEAMPRDAAEGAPLRVEVTRTAVGERGRLKLALVRPTPRPPRDAPSLAQQLHATGAPVRIVPRFPEDIWPELLGTAWDGAVEFDGGSLTISPTPAMTLVDVDGILSATALALSATASIAAAIRHLDLAGSIGIDFPSLERKVDRRAVDEALESALDDWPHQRTAMNGFGFVQIVARLERPSLIHRVWQDRAGAAARLLLRQAEHIQEPGALLLTAPPAVRASVPAAWEAELSRRTGREVRWQENSALALDGSFAQAVTR